MLRDVPARQQTLRKTIQWSYDLLAVQEQRLFRRLSVFVGGCTLQAIEALSAASWGRNGIVTGRVASLIDKNLLRQTAQEGEELRLTMLETIREYGLEVLCQARRDGNDPSGPCRLLPRAGRGSSTRVQGPQQAEWLERLEREHDNLRAALQWSLEPAQAGPGIEMALRLVRGARWSFGTCVVSIVRGRPFWSRPWRAAKELKLPVRARALNAAAGFAFGQGDYDRAEALLQESLVLYRQLGDTRGIASSLQGLG